MVCYIWGVSSTRTIMKCCWLLMTIIIDMEVQLVHKLITFLSQRFRLKIFKNVQFVLKHLPLVKPFDIFLVFIDFTKRYELLLCYCFINTKTNYIYVAMLVCDIWLRLKTIVVYSCNASGCNGFYCKTRMEN